MRMELGIQLGNMSDIYSTFDRNMGHGGASVLNGESS